MTRTNIQTAVNEAVAQLTGCSGRVISPSSALAEDLGVDSLLAVNMIVEIEDRLGARLPSGSEGSLVGVRSVGELVDRLSALFGAAA